MITLSIRQLLGLYLDKNLFEFNQLQKEILSVLDNIEQNDGLIKTEDEHARIVHLLGGLQEAIMSAKQSTEATSLQQYFNQLESEIAESIRYANTWQNSHQTMELSL
ncbi:MAG: hypothetical protein V2I33_06035 [Kangiellaceae bacterium]|nr:hypothetical protein [Kangiellaceae bacterium]